MFTGIIETTGNIESIVHENQTMVITIASNISNELKIDQSVAHNGICLTVIALGENTHTVCAVSETMLKTAIGQWKLHDIINLERCMKLNDRLDGHIVQGHVDTPATCVYKSDTNNNWVYRFEIPTTFNHLIIEKGSICVNGTSLTCFNVTKNTFEVAIIPYTYYHTSIRLIQEGDAVNIEFDIIGKYFARMQSLQQAS